MSGFRKYHISEEWLSEVVKKYTVRQIEQLFGISKSTIHLTMKRYGIESPRPAFIQPGEYARELQIQSCKKKKLRHL